MFRAASAIVALVTLTASAQGPLLPDPWTCTVEHVVDGETFDCNDVRIRARCLDTPDKGEPGFHLARSDATNLIMEGRVAVEGPYRRGRNGIVATVVDTDGKPFASKMRRLGWPNLLSDPLCNQRHAG